jgi:hypothetical protein
MGKKEFLKEENNAFGPAPASGKLSGAFNRVFDIIKLILGICFLPFVYSITVTFLDELAVIPKPAQDYFWSGVITLVLVYLFVWEPVFVYTKGQKLMELVFSFFKPLVKVAPYLLPIYTLILFAAYWLLSYIFKDLLHSFIFLFGFSISLHLVFSAKTMRAKKGDLLKSNYIFGFSFIYIVNLVLLAFCLNLLFDQYSFVRLLNNSYQGAGNIFHAAFKQLFIPS